MLIVATFAPSPPPAPEEFMTKEKVSLPVTLLYDLCVMETRLSLLDLISRKLLLLPSISFIVSLE